MIQVSNRNIYISPNEQHINVQNDMNAQTIDIVCPRYYDGVDLSQHTMYLKTISQGGRDDVLLTKTVTTNNISAVWTLKPPQTSYNGTLVIQLYFISATTVGTTTTVTFKWETKSAQMEIIRSEDASPVVPATPSAYQQWLAAIQEIADDAEESAEAAEEAKEAIEDMTATASIDANVGTPSVTVTKSTVEEHENLDFAFHNLKGADGEDGADGDDGVSVVNVAIDSRGHLICTLSDGRSVDAGEIGGGGGVYTALSGKADNPTIKTTMDSVAVVNTHYYLGTQTSVSVTLPSTASVGQSIAVIFYSGSTAATLSVSGTTIGTVPTPAVNQRIELILSYDGTNWAIKSNVIATA